MITAIPMKEDRIANHFTKADSFLFVNEIGDVLCRKPNPALNANCSGKDELLAMLQTENAQRVIVRNIGERFLGKLLESQFSVFQSNCGHQELKVLASQNVEQLTPLTDANQGRPSMNYKAKQANGGCGCNHDEHAAHGNCDHQHHESGDHGRRGGRCCENKEHSHIAGRGRSGGGRCCH